MGILDGLFSAAGSIGEALGNAKKAVAEQQKAAADQQKAAADAEAERKKAHEEGEYIARGLAALQGIPFDENAEGSTTKKLKTGVDAFWQHLREQWESQKEEGYVWTISIDSAVEMDVMGLVKAKYDLDLSASHVGWTMDGVYSGSMGFKFEAGVGGLNLMLAALGGRTNTSKLGGWFRNDQFVMELKPFNKAKEDAFINTLNYTLDELGAVDDAEIARIEAEHQAASAVINPMLQNMGSKPDAYELANAPVSYWFDWEYNMTEGDMSQFYSIKGLMGVASAQGSMNAAGDHVEAHGRAVTPFTGQVFTDHIVEDYHSPFPYVIHVYENGRVTFELHSQKGGPVVIIFRGKIDKIPVGQTTVVPQKEEKKAEAPAQPSGIEEAPAPAQPSGIEEAPAQSFGIEEV